LGSAAVYAHVPSSDSAFGTLLRCPEKRPKYCERVRTWHGTYVRTTHRVRNAKEVPEHNQAVVMKFTGKDVLE
jgi:hypothetical protein